MICTPKDLPDMNRDLLDAPHFPPETSSPLEDGRHWKETWGSMGMDQNLCLYRTWGWTSVVHTWVFLSITKCIVCIARPLPRFAPELVSQAVQAEPKNPRMWFYARDSCSNETRLFVKLLPRIWAPRHLQQMSCCGTSHLQDVADSAETSTEDNVFCTHSICQE